MFVAMARPLRLEVTVTSLAPRGDGVAHATIGGERRAVFLSATARGDVLRADVDPSTRPARGRVVELLAPGADRVAPACPWSVRCGGCDWMHLSTDAQRATHVEHVRAALPAAWRGIDVVSHGAAEALAYRTRARLHVRCERGRVAIGMHEAGTHDPVVVDVCAVLDPALEAARRVLPALFEGTRGRGEAQLALGVERRPVLELRWRGEMEPVFFSRLERAVNDGHLAGARVSIGEVARPAVVGDPTPWMRGADDQPLRLAPGGFGQASERMNASLARHVAEVVRPWAIDQAAELHAGGGNLTVLLAREVRELVAVESSRNGCEAARANLAARGLDVRVVETDAACFTWSAATKLVVLDPPRTGARLVAERLAASRVARVVYVSCDPQTLGRDLAIMAEAYAPTSIATFEMFPQTSHVETVVALERRRSAKRGRT
jgi:23S rRNA (uracil1939-C5)-methyltransferase